MSNNSNAATDTSVFDNKIKTTLPANLLKLLEEWSGDEVPDFLPDELFEESYSGEGYIVATRDPAKDAILQAIMQRNLVYATNQITQKTEQRTGAFHKYLRSQMAALSKRVDKERRHFTVSQWSESDVLRQELNKITFLPERPVPKDPVPVVLYDENDRNQRRRGNRRFRNKKPIQSKLPKLKPCNPTEILDKNSKLLRTAREKLRDIDIRRRVAPFAFRNEMPPDDSVNTKHFLSSEEEDLEDFSDYSSSSEEDTSVRSFHRHLRTPKPALRRESTKISDIDEPEPVREVRRQVTFMFSESSKADSQSKKGPKSKSVDITKTQRQHYDREVAPFRTNSQQPPPETLKERTKTIDEVMLQKRKPNVISATAISFDHAEFSKNRSPKITEQSPTITLPSLSRSTTNLSSSYRKPPTPIWQKRATPSMKHQGEQKAKQAMDASVKFLKQFDYAEEQED